MFNDFKREQPKKITGDVRLAITSAEETVSKSSGNPMLVVEVKVNDSNIKIKNYIVKNELFNVKVTELLESFGIEDDSFELLSWVGALGAGKLVEDEQGYLKVKHFISQAKQENLPEWVGKLPERQEINNFDDLDSCVEFDSEDPLNQLD